MENNTEILKKAIEIIKNKVALSGNIVTNEDVAQKAFLSNEQLQAYLNGDEEVPTDLITKIYDSYGFQSRIIEFRTKIYIDIPEEDDEDEGKIDNDKNP